MAPCARAGIKARVGALPFDLNLELAGPFTRGLELSGRTESRLEHKTSISAAGEATNPRA